MKIFITRYLVFFFLLICSLKVYSQSNKWRDIHKVKKKETLYSIAREYSITIEELTNANPEMKEPGYQLKKGSLVFIPYSSQTSQVTPAAPHNMVLQSVSKTDVRQREIRLGLLLPLHDINGDGRRMTEYYRGMLMACDSLRCEGISIRVDAFNASEQCNINTLLANPQLAQCDVIFGPLYSAQMPAISAFARQHDIKLFVPFSINAPQIKDNPTIYQVYQTPSEINASIVSRFLRQFKNHHTVLIDCNDSASTKGAFTSLLRSELKSAGRSVSITSTKSSENNFAKAFSKTSPNVVILNSERSPQLNVVFAKLNGLANNMPELQITLFGYTEWMMYTRYNLDNYYRFNVYIPATFYTNPLSSATRRFEQKYRWSFHEDMLAALPRFAITGFDHTYFFLKGLHEYGKNFNGAIGSIGYTPIQTPLGFERIGANGGWQNKRILMVNYSPSKQIRVIY